MYARVARASGLSEGVCVHRQLLRGRSLSAVERLAKLREAAQSFRFHSRVFPLGEQSPDREIDVYCSMGANGFGLEFLPRLAHDGSA